MAAVGELVLLLGLLVSAHCEVRARDPEEEEEREMGGRAGGGVGEVSLHLHRPPPEATERPLLGDRGSPPARTGNWCALVQSRVVTVVEACGSEKYTIKSQSRCPRGEPDCQLVMYKLSTRPLYRQKLQTVTALLWRCCPGHGGKNCEDSVTVSDAQLDPGHSALIGRSLTGVQQQHLHHHGDPNREQNDHQPPDTGYPDNQNNTTQLTPTNDTGHTHKPQNTSQLSANTYDHGLHHQHHHHHHHGDPQRPERHFPGVGEVGSSAPLPMPHMMALILSQLQPVLQGFNRSLELLSQQVGELAHDVAQLKTSRQGAEMQSEHRGRAEEQEEQAEQEEQEERQERIEVNLQEVFQQIREVQSQMETQRNVMENRLHSHHAMLHYNLTSFKMDVDAKMKRQQKMLQVSLQTMNATLTELNQNQDSGDLLFPPLQVPPPPTDTSALWEAVERLDNKVINNTVKVDGLMEDVDEVLGDVQHLRRNLNFLEKRINVTARTSQIQFMETGLEVEAAREAVLQRASELAVNMTQQGKQLEHLDQDVDYLWTVIYKQNISADCSCKGLQAAVAHLEKAVANVTELATGNRLALEGDSEGGTEGWGEARDWELAVKALQGQLQEVKDSVSSEQSRTVTLDLSLTDLNRSLSAAQAELSHLKEVDRKFEEEKERLSDSFSSLMADGLRHSDVLELLLGEEVLEFLEWPIQDQEAHSIPALKEQLRGHNLSITSLLSNRPGNREEVPSADEPADDWLSGGRRRSSGAPARERQLLGGDGGDLWNLEKTVEELGLKVLHLEDKCCNSSAPPSGVEAKLQAEVTWLRRGLEGHLRIFKNVFSNADVLIGSDTTLELDKLWQLVRSKDEKKKKERREGERNHGSRRTSPGDVSVLSSQSEASLLFVGGAPLTTSTGVILFDVSLNRGQLYSDGVAFKSPVGGLYLFVLTLDLKPGHAHVVLRRGGGRAQVSLHKQVAGAGPVTAVGLLPLSAGEEVRLELQGEVWADSQDNVFTVQLVHRTT